MGSMYLTSASLELTPPVPRIKRSLDENGDLTNHGPNKRQELSSALQFATNLVPSQPQTTADEDEARNSSEEEFNNDFCAACSRAGKLVLCDGCPNSFHLKCLKMKELPEGVWFCPDCTSQGITKKYSLKNERSSDPLAGHATLPAFGDDWKDPDEEDQSTLVWDCNAMDATTVDSFLSQARSDQHQISRKPFDEERALTTLHSCSYNVVAALHELQSHAVSQRNVRYGR